MKLISRLMMWLALLAVAASPAMVQAQDFQARGMAANAMQSAQSALGASKNPGAVGWRHCFLGDSITNGSSASFATLSFTYQVVEMMGASAAPLQTGGSLVSGHPGYTSGQIAPFMATDIIGKCDILVLLAGTNDVGQGVSLSTYAANMLGIFKQARAAGIRLFVLTIPPRGPNASPTAAQNLAMDQFNAWLRLVVPQYGTLVDVYPLMADPASNFNRMLGAYDSGDGVHPNSFGHWKPLAVPIVTAIKQSINRQQLLSGWSSLNLISNPYFMGNSQAQSSTGWFEQSGGTGTAPTYSYITDTTGKLSQGYWREMNFAPVGSSGNRIYATAVSTGFSVGDVLAFTAKLQIQDVAGNWQTIGPSGSGVGSVSLKLMNQTPAQIAGTSGVITSFGYPTTANQYDIGPSWQTFTVPAGTTQILIYLSVSLPAGANLKVRIGEVGLINLTTTGMVGVPLAANDNRPYLRRAA